MESYEVNVGDMKNSAVAVGPGALAAARSQGFARLAPDVLHDLEMLTELLAEHRSELEDEEEVLESVVAVRNELEKDKPNFQLAGAILRGISRSVSSIDVLADAVTKILNLIGHFCS